MQARCGQKLSNLLGKSSSYSQNARHLFLALLKASFDTHCCGSLVFLVSGRNGDAGSVGDDFVTGGNDGTALNPSGSVNITGFPLT